MVADPGVRISAVGLSSATGFNDLRQVRISGVQGGEVIPEPGTVTLLGMGALGALSMIRRRRCHSA